MDAVWELANRPLWPGGWLTLGELLGGLLVLLAGLVIARLTRRALLRTAADWEEQEETWLPACATAAHHVVVGVAVFTALHVAGLMDVGPLLAGSWLVLNFELVSLSGTRVTLATLLTVLAILAATWSASRLGQRAVGRALRRRNVESEGTVAALSRLLHYVVLALGLGVALQTVGIDLAALFAAGAVFAVGLGFAMQNIAQNFVSGVILLVERTIKPGDILEVEGETVRVTQMGIRATIARTRDEEDLLIPNSTLVQGTVKNFTMVDPLLRIRAAVGVTYDSDMRRVHEVLTAVGRDLAARRPEREPVVLLLGFGASSVDWELSIWTRDPWGAPQLRSEIYQAIWFALQEAGIVIAFPQLDVHLDEPVVDGLKALGGT